MDNVKFEDVIRAADGPRTSAYRAWGGGSGSGDAGPQERFHNALAATLAALGEVFEAMPDLSSATTAERGFRLRQIHRVGSNANQESMNDWMMWRCYISVDALLLHVGTVRHRRLRHRRRHRPAGTDQPPRHWHHAQLRTIDHGAG